MSDIERLSIMAAEGDRAAARELCHIASQRGDSRLLAFAAPTLGELPHIAEAIDALWSDTPKLVELGKRCGVVLDELTRIRIEDYLTTANRHRSLRKMTPGQVVAVLFDAATAVADYAFGHAGAAPASPSQPMTTLCIAARVDDDQIKLGLTQGGANNPTPGRGWDEMQPWRFGEDEANAAKVSAWSELAPDGTSFLVTRAPSSVVTAVRERRGREPSGPLVALRAVLAEDPSEKGFKKVIKLIDKWPKNDTEGREDALSLATETLSSWPDEHRVTGRAWLKRQGKNKPRPSDRLATTLQIEAVDDDDLAHFVGADSLHNVRCIRLSTGYRSSKGECKWTAQGVATMAAAACMRTVREVVFFADTRAGGGWMFLQSSTADSLERLEIRNSDPLDSYPERPAAFSIPNLRELKGKVCPALFELIEASGLGSSLVTLDTGRAVAATDMEAIAKTPALSALESLTVDFVEKNDEGGDVVPRTLAESETLSRLRTLNIRRLDCTDAGMAKLVESDLFARLESVDWTGNPVGDLTFSALADRGPIALKTIDLRTMYYRKGAEPPAIGPGLARWAKAESFANIEALCAVGRKVGDGVIRAMAESAYAKSVRMLWLRDCALTDESCALIAGSPNFQNLESLLLIDNAITADGFRALAKSVNLKKLAHLEVADNVIGAGTDALIPASNLPQLEVLGLNSAKVGDDGALALARMEYREHLWWIMLNIAGVGKVGKAALEGQDWIGKAVTGIPGHNSMGRSHRFTWDG